MKKSTSKIFIVMLLILSMVFTTPFFAFFDDTYAADGDPVSVVCSGVTKTYANLSTAFKDFQPGKSYDVTVSNGASLEEQGIKLETEIYGVSSITVSLHFNNNELVLVGNENYMFSVMYNVNLIVDGKATFSHDGSINSSYEAFYVHQGFPQLPTTLDLENATIVVNPQGYSATAIKNVGGVVNISNSTITVENTRAYDGTVTAISNGNSSGCTGKITATDSQIAVTATVQSGIFNIDSVTGIYDNGGNLDINGLTILINDRSTTCDSMIGIKSTGNSNFDFSGVKIIINSSGHIQKSLGIWLSGVDGGNYTIENPEIEIITNAENSTGIYTERGTTQINNAKIAVKTQGTLAAMSGTSCVQCCENVTTDYVGGKIRINGGYYYLNSTADNKFIMYGTTGVAGGCFSEEVNPAYVVNGYECTTNPEQYKDIAIGTGKYRFSYKVIPATEVINDRTQTTGNIIETVRDAQDGDTITLLKDVHIIDPLTIEKNITVNLGGFKLYSASPTVTKMFDISTDGGLSIKNNNDSTASNCINDYGMIAFGDGAFDTYNVNFYYKAVSGEADILFSGANLTTKVHSGGTYSGNVMPYCANGLIAVYDKWETIDGVRYKRYKIEQGPYMHSQSISLNGSLGVNFNIVLRGLANSYKQIYARAIYTNSAGEETTILSKVEDLECVGSDNDGNKKYVFRVNDIAAKQMSEKVTCQIVKCGQYETVNEIFSEKKYGIRDYVDNKFAGAGEPFQKLMVSMLEYGKCAQTYFDYKAEDPLIGIDVGDYLSRVNAVTIDDVETDYTESISAECRPAHTLELDGEISINFKFPMDVTGLELRHKKDISSDAIDDGELIDPETIKWEEKDGVKYYNVKIGGIRIQNIGDVHAVQIKDESGNAQIARYSVYDYIKNKAFDPEIVEEEGDKGGLKMLVRAMYVFSEDTRNYLESLKK